MQSNLQESKFTHPDVKAIINEIMVAVNIHSSVNAAAPPEVEVYLRVWDCGGQPVFLGLLPAFLTARTLFLLVFNAVHDLQRPCLHLSHQEGRATEEVAEVSTLELMIQWMATIHATLLKKAKL